MQLDRLNRESEEQQKTAAANANEMRKLKEKLAVKSEQIQDLNS